MLVWSFLLLCFGFNGRLCSHGPIAKAECFKRPCEFHVVALVCTISRRGVGMLLASELILVSQHRDWQLPAVMNLLSTTGAPPLNNCCIAIVICCCIKTWVVFWLNYGIPWLKCVVLEGWHGWRNAWEVRDYAEALSKCRHLLCRLFTHIRSITVSAA